MKDKVDGPSKPDGPDVADTEYEFNLGLYRIQTLAEILEVCAKKYRTAIMERDAESLHDYKAMVNTLYTEAYIYMKEETDFEIKKVKQNKDEILTKKLDDFSSPSGEEDIIEELQQTRDIYLEVRRLLQEVGIDIPKKQKVGKTDVFGGGG